ncbi:hypothetical protein Tco_1186657, partial [Tanacetum coccineum]
STTEYYKEEEDKIDDEETMIDDEDDEVTKELYEDVNVNLGYEDTEMTNANQGASEQQNVSQESGFEQVEKDAHATLTPVLDTQKADEPIQSSSISFAFTSKLLNLENPSPVDNKIASLMETSARHATAFPKNTSGFTTTIPPPPLFFNPLLQQATPMMYKGLKTKQKRWQATWHYSGGDTWHTNNWFQKVQVVQGSELAQYEGQISVRGLGRGQYKVSIPEASRWTGGMI